MTRGVPADLTGQRFGKLTAIGRRGSDSQGNALWLCRCDCGNDALVRGAFLKKGQEFCSKQCSLYVSEIRDDLTGRRYGRLVALNFVKVTPGRKTIWRFQCDCGTQPEIWISNIVNGHTQSCGCGERESRIKHGQSQTREYHREAHKEWAKRNPAKVIANVYKRKEALKQRVPPWLTDEHWDEINSFYLEAKRKTEETGIIHHVDHIIPLRGKRVTGLHVPWNLQVLTQAENLAKAARFSDDVC